MGKIWASDGYREGGGSGPGEGGRIQLIGLNTEELKGSLVVLYAPAGNSCLLRLVGHAWMDEWVLCWCDILECVCRTYNAFIKSIV